MKVISQGEHGLHRASGAFSPWASLYIWSNVFRFAFLSSLPGKFGSEMFLLLCDVKKK